MLNQQAIDVSFAQGLDTKTDPKRLSMGKFTKLENSVFTTGDRLTKRSGYARLTDLPDNSYSYLTTLNDNLTAFGSNIAAYSSSTSTWVKKGSIQPLAMSTLPLLRNNLNQTACDSAIAANGLVCTAYIETDGSTITNKYVIANSVTGQNISAPAAIPVASGVVSGGMHIFLLGNFFVIVFTNTITGTAHLQYIAISIQTQVVTIANTDIAAAYVSNARLSWDGVVVNNKLYIAYNTTTGSQRISIKTLSTSFIVSAATNFIGFTAAIMSVTADISIPSAPTIYISFQNANVAWTAAVDQNLNLIMNPGQLISSTPNIVNITSAAQNGTCFIFLEFVSPYTWDTSIPSNRIDTVMVTPLITNFKSVFSSGAGTITASTATGLVNGMTLIDNTTPANITSNTTFTVSGTTLTLSQNTAGNSASNPGDTMTAATIGAPFGTIRSVGLASKAFIVEGTIYFLSAFQSPYQNSYFLINGSTSTQINPVVVAKLAYQNGGGYLPTGLPGVTVTSGTAQVPYLFKDLIQAVNKNTNVATGTQTAGIYSQTGINLVTFVAGTANLDTVEIAKTLEISGGFLWMYDGYLPVEHNFFLYPDTKQKADGTGFQAVWSDNGGSMDAKRGGTNTNAYWYQFTYEWTDNNGNAYRSAPSIPINVTTTNSGTSGSITINIPALRLTYKISNPVKLVVYRWSLDQQIYYQTTSISSPTLNNPAVDTVQFIDTNSDATILGNNILYTTGGVVADVNAPGTNIMTIFDTRFWMVDAEDQNVLWYSKQVIEGVPVEMSDLFTMYIPPTTSVQGTTGPITALAPMDDKLIIFKKNGAIYYINGRGPDNTGANSQYSEPIFITSTVGCLDQQSIVLLPQGLQFQSNKGIWLLGRDLVTQYIGAPVEAFNSATVLSANSVPQTNYVLFTLNNNYTLMYDYYYGQWGTFKGIPAVSSCIYQGLHTFINSIGAVYQSSPGAYLDGSNPVLMAFTTGPLRVGELQNYQRAYSFYLLGEYSTPHKLLVNIAYDYNINPSQSTILIPNNSAPVLGASSPLGDGSPLGGPATLESYRIFLEQQRCQAFTIDLQEVYDGSYGVPAGAGLTISGLNIICGFKKGYRPFSAAQSFG